MPLSPGTRIGAFEVLEPLGAGGMGEVYRARDSKLGREVALKILPDDLASDPERLARFEREAQVLAALNHPHIAAIYGVEEGPAREGRARALVLELVEGETLADLVSRGALPIEDALAIARQILDALETAHASGIVHRDLKPANVKVAPDGRVKVLDFGLAKLSGGEQARSGVRHDLTVSPTITSPAMQTGAGIILGTAAYMAPEQARGRTVDRRADVWAFGCVLFEMLAGVRPFGGSDVTEVLADVLKSDPPWRLLPASTPPRVRTTLERCLEKDPSRRMRDCGDVRLALDGAFETLVPAPAPATVRPRGALWLAAGAAVVAILAAIAAAVAGGRGGAEPPPLVRFQVPALPNLLTLFTLSPDGRHMAMLASNAEGRSGLWVHSFESGQTRELQQAGSVGMMPFWSPDGRFLAYSIAGGLYRIDIAGGPPERIVPTTARFTHGAWSPSGTIVVGGTQGGLMQLPAAGGDIVPLTAIDASRQETIHLGPSFLPDGRRFLYMRISQDPDRSGIYVGSLDAQPDAQPATRLMPSERIAVYAGSGDFSRGHVLFMRDRALMAQALDLDSLQLAGEPLLVAENVGTEGVVTGRFSASMNGVIAYRHSEEFLVGGTPVWVNRNGQEIGAATSNAPNNALYPQISPDGTRVALVVQNDVWVHHLDGRPPIKLTFAGSAYSPVWAPDGSRLAFEYLRRVHVLPSDGSGGAPQPLTPDGHVHPHGWARDGRVIVAFDGGNQSNPWDVGQVPAAGGGSIEPIVQTPANEGQTGAALSPDGRWLAYVSNATGADEVWVRPYGGTGAPVRVSAAGGGMPVWARDSRELYFLEAVPDGAWRVKAARLDPGPGLRFAPPQQLFESSYALGGQPPSYDVAADGRFLMLKRDRSRPAEPTHVILNWRGTFEGD